jgi:hypothetical protein
MVMNIRWIALAQPKHLLPRITHITLIAHFLMRMISDEFIGVKQHSIHMLQLSDYDWNCPNCLT